MKKTLFLIILLAAVCVLGAESESCVRIGQTELFCISAADGNLAPAQRASIATRAIEDIMTDRDGELDSLKKEGSDSLYTIVYRGTLQGKSHQVLRVINVVPEDTAGTGQTLARLADKWYWDIRKGISSERQRSLSFDNLAKLALGVLFPFLVLILYYLIDKLYRTVSKSVVRRDGVNFKGISIGKMEIIPPRLQVQIILKFMLILKWVIIALAMYAMIYVFFTLFPTTQQYSQMLLDTSVEWLKKLVIILFDVLKFAIAGFFLYLVARILWAVVDMIFKHYEDNPDSTRIPDNAISPLKRLFRAIIALVFVIALVAVIPGRGEYLAFGLFILTGVFLGISSLPYIAGIFAGLAMVLARKIKTGDRVRVDKIEGRVEMIGIVWTRIITDDGEDVVLFNTRIIQAPIIRENKPAELKDESVSSEKTNV